MVSNPLMFNMFMALSMNVLGLVYPNLALKSHFRLGLDLDSALDDEWALVFENEKQVCFINNFTSRKNVSSEFSWQILKGFLHGQ